MEDKKVSLIEKLLMRFWPKAFFKRIAGKMDIDPWFSELGHKLFSKSGRIDLFPLGSEGGRGFLLVIDNHTSFWFYQDGDKFTYDGFEIGGYQNGDVTIFDSLSTKSSPWE